MTSKLIQPSLRFATVRHFGDVRTAQTLYICGRNTRSESRNCTGRSTTNSLTGIEYVYGPLRARILNRDLGYRFELEPATRLYTAVRVNQDGSSLRLKPQRIEAAKRSGRSVHIRIETTNTGERGEFFGYAARRVITRTIRTRDAEWMGESECDGWYIAPPAAWLLLHSIPKQGAFHYVETSSGERERDDYRFTEVGKRETGFMVLATRTHRFYSEDKTGNAKVLENIYREEITEFSQASIGANRFVPPGDSRRVSQLSNKTPYPLRHQVERRWEMLKDSFILPKRIARFIA